MIKDLHAVVAKRTVVGSGRAINAAGRAKFESKHVTFGYHVDKFHNIDRLVLLVLLRNLQVVFVDLIVDYNFRNNAWIHR